MLEVGIPGTAAPSQQQPPHAAALAGRRRVVLPARQRREAGALKLPASPLKEESEVRIFLSWLSCAEQVELTRSPLQGGICPRWVCPWG